MPSRGAADETLPSSSSPALTFQVIAQCGRARSSRMTLPHHECRTPMFMPVGTQGSVKGLTSRQLQDLDCHVILGNTYHLENRPGSELVAGMGGEDGTEPFLGSVDKIGTAYTDDTLATGFGSYLALPIMRERWRPDLEEGEARALLEDCLRVLFYRDCRAYNRVQIAKVTRDGGVLVSDPYEIDTKWDSASFVEPKGQLDGDGGW